VTEEVYFLIFLIDNKFQLEYPSIWTIKQNESTLLTYIKRTPCYVSSPLHNLTKMGLANERHSKASQSYD